MSDLHIVTSIENGVYTKKKTVDGQTATITIKDTNKNGHIDNNDAFKVTGDVSIFTADDISNFYSDKKSKTEVKYDGNDTGKSDLSDITLGEDGKTFNAEAGKEYKLGSLMSALNKSNSNATAPAGLSYTPQAFNGFSGVSSPASVSSNPFPNYDMLMNGLTPNTFAGIENSAPMMLANAYKPVIAGACLTFNPTLYMATMGSFLSQMMAMLTGTQPVAATTSTPTPVVKEEIPAPVVKEETPAPIAKEETPVAEEVAPVAKELPVVKEAPKATPELKVAVPVSKEAAKPATATQVSSTDSLENLDRIEAERLKNAVLQGKISELEALEAKLKGLQKEMLTLGGDRGGVATNAWTQKGLIDQIAKLKREIADKESGKTVSQPGSKMSKIAKRADVCIAAYDSATDPQVKRNFQDAIYVWYDALKKESEKNPTADKTDLYRIARFVHKF